jgi:hypothetical protein
MASNRPEFAAQWVGTIADETKRNQQTETIAQTWLTRDPAAARAWLRQTALPEPTKQRLLANFNERL